MLGGAFWKEVLTALVALLCVRCVAGTSMPVQIIMSGSMEPQIQVGDLVLAVGPGGSPYAVGDIITFQRTGEPSRTPIIHRIVATTSRGQPCILTKGDNNPVDDYRGGLYAPGERCVAPDNILSRFRGQIPLIGQPWVWLAHSLGDAAFIVFRLALAIIVLAHAAITG
jgi:signal peptidase I